MPFTCTRFDPSSSRLAKAPLSLRVSMLPKKMCQRVTSRFNWRAHPCLQPDISHRMACRCASPMQQVLFPSTQPCHFSSWLIDGPSSEHVAYEKIAMINVAPQPVGSSMLPTWHCSPKRNMDMPSPYVTNALPWHLVPSLPISVIWGALEPLNLWVSMLPKKTCQWATSRLDLKAHPCLQPNIAHRMTCKLASPTMQQVLFPSSWPHPCPSRLIEDPSSPRMSMLP